MSELLVQRAFLSVRVNREFRERVHRAGRHHSTSTPLLCGLSCSGVDVAALGLVAFQQPASGSRKEHVSRARG